MPSALLGDFGLAPFAAFQQGRAQAIARFVEGDLLIGVKDGSLETAMVIAVSDEGALMLSMPNGGRPFWVLNASLEDWRRPAPRGARLVEIIDNESDEILWATYAPDLHAAMTIRAAVADINPGVRVVIETPYNEELDYLERTESSNRQVVAG